MQGVSDKTLRMTFDPNVIDDLGAKLYSTLPPIISELVANGYDAGASTVKIELHDGATQADRKIVITDDGAGMSFDQINDMYLAIGRKKREHSLPPTKTPKRLPIGKKGLGKLSFFGIARVAKIETVQNKQKVTFVMDLDVIHKSGQLYEPKFTEETVNEADGTKISLSGMYRKTEFDIDSLTKSISNYFIFDEDFRVLIKKSEDPKFLEIDNSLRYEHPDRQAKYEWVFPETGLREGVKQFEFSKHVKGKVILFNLPVRSNLRGVTLFSRNKLVNLPEFFPVQGSSYFYQYLTGWLEVDFIDDIVPDVISTNRSSLAWNDPSLSDLKEYLEEVIRLIRSEWRRLEAEAAKQRVAEKFEVDPDDWRESNKNNKTITRNLDRLIPLLDEPEKIPQDELLKMVEIVHDLAPEHADFVLWRNLSKIIRDNEVIKEKFFQAKYLEAAREAVQIYEEEVKRVCGGSEKIGQDLMGEMFGADANKRVWITDKSNESKRNIDEGHKFLSMGIMTGFKNPAVSHTSLTEGLKIRDFTDKNCLDILSTISYLFDRLEKRVKPAV